MAKKFCGIAKVAPGESKTGNGFVKYRFNDIEKFVAFMSKKYNNLYWINIFANQADKPGYQKLIYTWGSKKGLEPAR